MCGVRIELSTPLLEPRFEQGEKEVVPVAVLFSGGLDSVILAALLDQWLDPKYEVDLLNVSFDGAYAPERISAKAGVKELKKVAPLRRWKLVEIDADLSKLASETKRVMSLINPADTYMVAKLLGLHEVAKMPKRAIQFGSTIARESNRKNFGSNRAANQALLGA